MLLVVVAGYFGMKEKRIEKLLMRFVNKEKILEKEVKKLKGKKLETILLIFLDNFPNFLIFWLYRLL